jgi:hypothetical protein
MDPGGFFLFSTQFCAARCAGWIAANCPDKGRENLRYTVGCYARKRGNSYFGLVFM